MLATIHTAGRIEPRMADKININTAAPKDLTQLPGIAKNLAYRIVNHRKRHGFFTNWQELLQVKEFPVEALPEIKKRATLEPPPDVHRWDFVGPRRVKPAHLEEVGKKPRAYTKSIRSTRRQDRMKPSA
jgi:hypothetical protein